MVEFGEEFLGSGTAVGGDVDAIAILQIFDQAGVDVVDLFGVEEGAVETRGDVGVFDQGQ